MPPSVFGPIHLVAIRQPNACVSAAAAHDRTGRRRLQTLVRQLLTASVEWCPYFVAHGAMAQHRGTHHIDRANGFLLAIDVVKVELFAPLLNFSGSAGNRRMRRLTAEDECSLTFIWMDTPIRQFELQMGLSRVICGE